MLRALAIFVLLVAAHAPVMSFLPGSVFVSPSAVAPPPSANRDSMLLLGAA